MTFILRDGPRQTWTLDGTCNARFLTLRGMWECIGHVKSRSMRDQNSTFGLYLRLGVLCRSLLKELEQPEVHDQPF
jgi:hypothetical protein